MHKYDQKIYKLALQHILVNIRLCPNLMVNKRCDDVLKYQRLTWVIWNFMRDLSNCEQCMFILYYNYLIFLYKSYGQKYVGDFLTKFGCYYNYYVVIWRNKFELSL
jgi:hypothetical protein